MAAEGVERGAKALGHSVKVETQGSVGAQNTLTPQEIAEADLVIIAADTNVDLSRFAGKALYMSPTKDAIGDGKALVARAFAEARLRPGGAGAPAVSANLADQVAAEKAARAAARTGIYKHLMTGVSYMLPFVVAGGLLIAISFALGGIYVYDDAHKGTLGQALFLIGAKSSFALMVPILAGFIAYSIADRPGIAPGAVGGMLANAIGAGFLGGIVAGFLAGYIVKFLNDHINLGKNLAGLKPVLILPLLGSAIVGLLMIYVIGEPVATALAAMTAWLKGMQTGNAIVLGAIIGAMMAFDMGGPVNKSAYTFATGLIASQVYGPMAAAMVAGMTPPLALALASKAVRRPLQRGRARGRQRRLRPRPLLHHRRRDPLRGQGSVARDPVPDGGLGGRRHDLDGPRLRTEGAPRRRLRPADPQRGHQPRRLSHRHDRRNDRLRDPAAPRKAQDRGLRRDRSNFGRRRRHVLRRRRKDGATFVCALTHALLQRSRSFTPTAKVRNGRTFAVPDPLLRSALPLSCPVPASPRQSSPMAMAKNVMRDLAPDPPAESMHHRPHEAGALLGRKDRDRAGGQAGEDEESHEGAP